MIKLQLLNGKDIYVNLEQVVTISDDRGGSKLVFTSGTAITVKQQPADLFEEKTIVMKHTGINA